MTDIYEYKARKYKLKYLKLRRKYIGEGGVIINNGFNIAKRLIEKDDLIKLDIQKQNGEPYFDNIDRFEGILLNVDNYNKILKIKEYDPYSFNTPIIKYIEKIKQFTPLEEVEEVSKDIISIMNIYVAKVNGMRKYKKPINDVKKCFKENCK